MAEAVTDPTNDPCWHDFSGTDDPDVWACNGCPYVYREVRDPGGSFQVFRATGEEYRVRHDVVVPAALANGGAE